MIAGGDPFSLGSPVIRGRTTSANKVSSSSVICPYTAVGFGDSQHDQPNLFAPTKTIQMAFFWTFWTFWLPFWVLQPVFVTGCRCQLSPVPLPLLSPSAAAAAERPRLAAPGGAQLGAA